MKLVALFLLCCLALFVLPIGASAQLNFTLTPLSAVGAPGEMLTFSGTLQNTGGVELFLNGYTTSSFDPSLTLDDTKFFVNVPLSLQQGEQWTGQLFDIAVSPSASSQDYSFSFTILGGQASDGQAELATQNATITVPVAAPEPAPLTIFILAALGITTLVVKQRVCGR